MNTAKDKQFFETTSNQPRTQKFTVNPELARQWISRNVKTNRNLNPERINQYARDMVADKWKCNGETIKFARTGGLIDGQHRLMACIQAKVSFETYVIFDLDDDAILTIDGCMVRSTAQMMKMTRGTVHAQTLSGALSWLWKYKRNAMSQKVAPSRHEAVALLDEHPSLEDSVKRTVKIDLCPKSISAFCHYLFARQDEVLATAFFDALQTGEHMKAGDPVFLLRERLIANRISKAKLPANELVALFFKSWQWTKMGKPMKSLRWAHEEAYPDIADDLKTGVLYKRKRSVRFTTLAEKAGL